ncbi:MAG: HAMP domain-containing sensor histidine kinase [Myxococcota bacterium]|nr:HAMP domain-containing sensor histidine kinase [Myxococcota bacterium]
MGLRLKVVLMLFAVVMPLLSGYSLYRFSVERRLQHERHAERVAGRIQERPLAICRNVLGVSPPDEGARAKRPRRARRLPPMFAYSSSFESLHIGQPAVPEKAQASFLSDGAGEIVHVSLWRHPDWSGVTLVPIEGTAGCEVVMIPWPSKPDRAERAIYGLVVRQSMVMALLLLLTGMLISIPLVARVRRLTEEVEEAPENAWSISSDLLGGKDEISVLARTFRQTGVRVQETIEQLEQRDTALKEYISNTTHDLAIPLTVLQHRLTRLREEAERGDAISVEQIEVALEESHYIAALIANMSAAARLEAGESHRLDHEVNLVELIERVVGRNRPIARQRQIEIDWAAPEVLNVLGDSTLIEQALSNLVQNAVQYNEPGGHVAVVAEVDGEHFVLRVLDDGPGVPPEKLETLSQRAVRGDARNRNPGGQGFGLSITTRVCEVHDFDLSLENGEEGGLIVSIRGPLGAFGA